MAGLICLFSTPASPGGLDVAAGATVTLAQLTAPANHRLKIMGFSAWSNASNPSQSPIDVRLYRQTGGTLTTGTPSVMNGAAETPQATAKFHATVQPTLTGEAVAFGRLNPTSGYVTFVPMGQEVIVPGGGLLGLVVTNNTSATQKIFFSLQYEE